MVAPSVASIILDSFAVLVVILTILDYLLALAVGTCHPFFLVSTSLFYISRLNDPVPKPITVLKSVLQTRRKGQNNHRSPYPDGYCRGAVSAPADAPVASLISRKGSIIETIIDQFKNISQIEHSRHRSPINALINVICGLIVNVTNQRSVL